jgi:hypothetical protein
MTKKLFVLVILLLGGFILSNNASAQYLQWQRTYGWVGSSSNIGYSVQQTTDGGYIVAGSTVPFGENLDVYLIKTNSAGDTLWTRTYGGTGPGADDIAYSVQETSDGGYIVTGTTRSSVSEPFHVYLIKTDSLGDTLWTRIYGGWGYGYSVQQTTDGGYVITGDMYSSGNWDVCLIKTNSAGDTLWTRTYRSSNRDEGYFVQQTRDGGFIVTGTTQGGYNYFDLYLLKTDSLGDSLWTVIWGVPLEYDEGRCVRQTRDGGYIVAGCTYAGNTMDVLLLRADSAGNVVWTRRIGDNGSVPQQAYSVQLTRDDGYIVAGMTGLYNKDVYLIRTDSNGEPVWIRTYDANYYDYGNSVDTTSDGGYIVAGWTAPYGGQNSQVYLIKISDGFKPNTNGWQFANNEENMWPEAWWSQFDYTQSPPYPYEWRWFCKSSDFPDWPLFVAAFGENQCYSNPHTGSTIYSPLAVEKWKRIKHEWNGSCFGFAISSLLYFNGYLSLSSTFSEYSNLYEVPLSNSSRKLVNNYFLYQAGEEHLAYWNANYRKTVIETLNEVKQMLVDQRVNNRSLLLLNQNGHGGGHAVVACSLAQDVVNPGLYHVFIYDNNYPGSYEVIDIDSTEGTWYYNRMQNWGGSEGILLSDSIDTYAQPPKLSMEPTDFLEIYNSSYADIVIRNSIGESIGFSNSNSTIIDSMANASPIIPITGTEHPPIGYFLPNDIYTAQISHNIDTVVYFSVFSESSVFSYERHDFQLGDTDNLKYFADGREFQVKNDNLNSKTVVLKSISILVDRQMVCGLQNLTLAQLDSLQLEIIDNTKFEVINTGSTKSYDLTLELATDSLNPIFKHYEIGVLAFSAHQISPNWEHLDSLPVSILVDYNLDGTFDDTLYMENQYLLRGDANGDGVIDISDVVYLINYLFIHGPAPVPLAAGDATCDGVVDASDLVYLLNYLFAHGPAPGC